MTTAAAKNGHAVLGVDQPASQQYCSPAPAVTGPDRRARTDPLEIEQSISRRRLSKAGNRLKDDQI
jgi:hypothetical protein